MNNTPMKTLIPLLTLLCFAQMGTIYDNGLITIAMSSIIASTGATLAQMQILIALYPLLAGSMMIVGGFIGSLYGQKKLFIIGLILLAFAEFLAGISVNVAMLTIARVLSGIAASALIPAVLGLITESFHDKNRTIAFSAIAACSAFISAFGPLFAGSIIQLISWRVGFISLGAFFAILVIFIKLIPEYKPSAKKAFDYFGTFILVAGILTFMFSVNMISSWGFIFAKSDIVSLFGLSPCILLLAISALMLIGAFLYEKNRQARGLSFLLPKEIITCKETRAGLYMTALSFLIVGGLLFLAISFLQIIIGYSTLKSAIFFVIFAIGMILSSSLSPVLVNHFSIKKLCRLGIILGTIGCLIIAFLITPNSYESALCVGLFICGLGTGIISALAGTIVTNSIPQELAELSSGIQGSVRNIGQTIGVALSGAALVAALTFSIGYHLKKDAPELYSQVSTYVTKGIPLIDKAHLTKKLNKIALDKTEKNMLISVNTQGQFVAIRFAFIVMAMMIFAFILGTGGLRNTP